MGSQTVGQGEVEVSVTLPQGLRPQRVELWVDVADEGELARMVEALGGLEGLPPIDRTSRYIPIGVRSPSGGVLTVNLWLADGMLPDSSSPPIPALERLRARQDAAVERARSARAAEDAAAGGRAVGRAVGVQDGRVVETNG